MDYEKLYKEALERASKLRVQNPFDTVSQMMEHVFPELKESDDERIRQKLIRLVYISYNQLFPYTPTKEEYEEMTAWLEKQGERKLAWSEEDEKKLIKVISIVQNVSSYDNQLDGYIEWLKSLRPQNLWKPSDEQIKAIRLARSFVVDDFCDHPTLSEILMELEEQLQKIKEE